MANDTRLLILMCLINNAEEMTLAKISKELEMPHQLVRYHLPFLLDAGLIIKNDKKYFCQPGFIDPEKQQKITELQGEIALILLEGLFLDFDKEDDKKQALINCLSIQAQLSVQSLKNLFAVN